MQRHLQSQLFLLQFCVFLQVVNSFQAVLVSDAAGDVYTIFKYKDMQWRDDDDMVT